MTKKMRAFILKVGLGELGMDRPLSLFSLCPLCLCGLFINLRHRNAQGISRNSLPQPFIQDFPYWRGPPLECKIKTFNHRGTENTEGLYALSLPNLEAIHDCFIKLVTGKIRASILKMGLGELEMGKLLSKKDVLLNGLHIKSTQEKGWIRSVKYT